MNVLRLIFNTLSELLQAIIYKWLLAIGSIVKRFIDCFRKFKRYHQLPHDFRDVTDKGCGEIDHPSYHRADPLIYSQKYLLSKGLAVTWNNPDIILLQNGVIVDEANLQPNTEYEIDATIWNNSYDAPVVGMAVNFSYLSFGASTTVTPIGTTVVDIGAKGTTSQPALARMKWITPPAGHYCIQVDFYWADDLNPDNNIGQNNVDVREAHSPAVFHFDLRNSGKRADEFHFETDTYTLPPPVECEAQIDRSKTVDQRWEEIKKRHNREDYPVPPGWTIIITPATAQLQPNEIKSIEVAIEPPADFSGSQSVNINAVSKSGRHAGGVTLTVTKA
jgi:hypothetical protein